jgi:hypothetical protein
MTRRKDAFVLNLWFDGDDQPEAQTQWRGSIEHLSTSERLYFREVSELVNFLSTWSGRRPRN